MRPILPVARIAAYEMCPIVTGTRELTDLDTAELAAAIRHEVMTCGPVIGSDVAVAQRHAR